MMEMSEAVTYTNLVQGCAQRGETGNNGDNVYAEIGQLQNVPADTDDMDYLEPDRHGQHDTPTLIPSPYSTIQAPVIQDPAEKPATTGQRTWTAAFAKRWKLCALLLIFVGLGLAFGAGVLYDRSTLDRKDFRGVNHCASSPCQNGGECFSGLDSFLCNCTQAFTGAYCQTGVNHCASSPCQNGGECVAGLESFLCNCTQSFTGAYCQTDIDVDECASNPCPADAACSNEIGGYTCLCDISTVTRRDCEEVRIAMCSVSGVYTVTPSGGTPIQVFCDMDTSEGGWLVFQKRQDGLVDFYRNWQSYAVGFGDPNGEFWLGNRNLHLLTQQKTYTLRVELSDWEGNQSYAQYSSFTIGAEQDKFRLGLSGYTGNAGDPLRDNSRRPFSARDQDNDGWIGQCAQRRRGAWWYGGTGCGQSNLNGHYHRGGPYTAAQSQTGSYDGVFWYHWRNTVLYSLKTTRMMIRPAP